MSGTLDGTLEKLLVNYAPISYGKVLRAVEGSKARYIARIVARSVYVSIFIPQEKLWVTCSREA